MVSIRLMTLTGSVHRGRSAEGGNARGCAESGAPFMHSYVLLKGK
jgi:hypothetical protein